MYRPHLLTGSGGLYRQGVPSSMQPVRLSSRKLLALATFALFAGTLAGSIFALAAEAQTPTATAKPAPAPKSAPAGTPTRFQPTLVPWRAAAFYESIWGIDQLSVRAVESGELLRFTYHVVDAERSKPLNDKKSEPSLIFAAGHVKLVIPSLEKVGQLRQSSMPEAGKSYWMAFSNPGRAVKRGDRVDVVIGQFRADGLIVE